MAVEKTLGELVDELCIVNTKIFALTEQRRSLPRGPFGKMRAGDIAQQIDDLNTKRSQLKNAINERDPSAVPEVKL